MAATVDPADPVTREPSAAPTPVVGAQRLAAIVGLVLLAFGALGFVGSSSFATGDDLAGGTFLGFEVNGWANLLHIAAGLLLLIASARRSTTRAAWRLVAFAALVALVAGLIDGEDVFGLVPVNDADQIADAALLVLAIIGARGAKERRSVLVRDRLVPEARSASHVVGPGSGHVGGPRRNAARIDARI